MKLHIKKIVLAVFALAVAGVGYAQSDYENGTLSILKTDGTTFTYPVRNIDSITFVKNDVPVRPAQKLAIQYVADRNMTSPTTFAETTKNNDCSHYQWETAQASFNEVTVDGKKWHLPSAAEWRSIFPNEEGGRTISFLYVQCNTDLDEAIDVHGVRKSYKADYNSVDKSTCYALKFKKSNTQAEEGFAPAADNSLLCAYRYQLVGDFRNPGNLDAHMLVTVCYLGNGFQGDIKTISNPEWWKDYRSAHPDLCFEKTFPASGWNDTSGGAGEIVSVGTGGRYWSGSVVEGYPGFAWAFNFHAAAARLYPIHVTTDYAIRLFSND